MSNHSYKLCKVVYTIQTKKHPYVSILGQAPRTISTLLPVPPTLAPSYGRPPRPPSSSASGGHPPGIALPPDFLPTDGPPFPQGGQPPGGGQPPDPVPTDSKTSGPPSPPGTGQPPSTAQTDGQPPSPRPSTTSARQRSSTSGGYSVGSPTAASKIVAVTTEPVTTAPSPDTFLISSLRWKCIPDVVPTDGKKAVTLILNNRYRTINLSIQAYL